VFIILLEHDLHGREFKKNPPENYEIYMAKTIMVPPVQQKYT